MDPQILAHLARWRQFSLSSQRLEASEPVDHALLAIARFYAALHLVQAYLLTKGERFEAANHGQRWAVLKTAPELRPLLEPYKRLRALSESARYDPGWSPPASLRADVRLALSQVERTLEGKLFARGYPLT